MKSGQATFLVMIFLGLALTPLVAEAQEPTKVARVGAEPMGEPILPILGVHLLVGNDIKTKAYNLHRNLDEARVSLVEVVAVKPNA